MLLADDLGWTDLGCQGSSFYETPNLDRLASEGVRFTQAYAACCVCSPTRAALMTGKSPAQLQYTDVSGAADLTGPIFLTFFVGQPLSSPLVPTSLPPQILINQRLAQAIPEYRTAMTGKWCAGLPHPLDRGFDAYSNGNTGAPPTEDPKDILGVTSFANQFMEESVNLGQPFFVMLSHLAVHWPFEAQPELVAVYENLPPGERHSDPTFN